MFPYTMGGCMRATAVAVCAAVLTPATVRADESGTYTCPVLGSKIGVAARATLASDYQGVRYYFCCAGCKPRFEKDQSRFLKSLNPSAPAVGAALFDPTTMKRIDPDRAAVHRDYNGVRYYFAEADGRIAFDKEPGKYAVTPDRELLFCPVSDKKIASYAEAAEYSDYKGTRYYFCCVGCRPRFDRSPDRYLDGLEARVQASQGEKQ